MMVTLAFVTAILLAAYLIFARAWMQYQAEQTLYCLSENRPATVCKHQLSQRLRAALPWGEFNGATTYQTQRGRWTEWNVDVEWKWLNHQIRVRKKLPSRALVQSKVLRW